MLKIYKNKTTTFKCEVVVESEGKNIKNVKSRLILYPSNDNRNVMYEGVVQDNICSININPDINITETGKAILEIIVDDSTIFMPWNSTYEIVSEKVKVESAKLVYDTNKTKVFVNEIKDDLPTKNVITEIKKPVKKNKSSFNDLLEEAANMVNDITDHDKKLLKLYNESIKSLSKNNLMEMIKFVKENYVPSNESLKWAKKVLGETKSVKSKLLMFCNEIKK